MLSPLNFQAFKAKVQAKVGIEADVANPFKSWRAFIFLLFKISEFFASTERLVIFKLWRRRRRPKLRLEVRLKLRRCLRRRQKPRPQPKTKPRPKPKRWLKLRLGAKAKATTKAKIAAKAKAKTVMNVKKSEFSKYSQLISKSFQLLIIYMFK